jgi:hypothetical protein
VSARTAAEKIAKLVYPDIVLSVIPPGVIDTFEAIIDEHGQDEYDQAIEDYWPEIFSDTLTKPARGTRPITRKARSAS